MGLAPIHFQAVHALEEAMQSTRLFIVTLGSLSLAGARESESPGARPSLTRPVGR
jgi:hypothetical protein